MVGPTLFFLKKISWVFLISEGAPALWSPPTLAPKMKPDSGKIFIDQNAARNPKHPLEPLFRALVTQKPDFAIGDVDLVTDRNNIRKLLSFIDPSTAKRGLEAFTITIEIIKKTAIVFFSAEVG